MTFCQVISYVVLNGDMCVNDMEGRVMTLRYCLMVYLGGGWKLTLLRGGITAPHAEFLM